MAELEVAIVQSGFPIDHAAWIERAVGAQLVIFPELSLTGYDLGAGDCPISDPRLDVIAAACARANSVAVVGAPFERQLAALVIDGNGVVDVYGKHLLHGEERAIFTPGERHVVIDVAGRSVGFGICFDTAHTEHACAARAAGAELYVVSALFVEGEEDKLESRFPDLAEDAGLWVVMANWTGPTSIGEACGRSGAWSPDGRRVAASTQLGPELLRFQLPG